LAQKLAGFGGIGMRIGKVHGWACDSDPRETMTPHEGTPYRPGQNKGIMHLIGKLASLSPRVAMDDVSLFRRVGSWASNGV
jgi:hypothetical protein